MKAETLKKSILQYAMQGKLVAQDPNDEPASELLKRIKAEKDQLIKDGKIKKEKPLPPITEEEIPYELPQGWEWVRLSEILNKICAGGDKPKNFTEFKTDKNIYPVIANGEKNNGILGYSDIPTIQEKSLTVSGRGTMGFVCIREPNYIPIVRLLVLVPNKYVETKFLKYLLTYLSENGQGTVVKQLTVPMLSPKVISLPPLAEQQRIVEKLEEILPLVEEYGKNEEILSEMNKKLPKQIRQSILQYAVQGKLVPQNPNDEPASELLKRIKAEKEQLIKDGKIKKEKPLPPITEDEIPYELPQGWEWCRLGSILTKLTDGAHKTPTYTNSGIPFLSVKDMSTGKLNFSNTKFVSKEEHEILYKRCNPQKGDLLVTKVGTTGVPVIVDTDREFSLFVSVALLKFNNELINIKYLYYMILSPLVAEQVRANTKGVGNQNWVIDKIAQTIITIPPLAEQQRIVAKVEELMQIVDKLEF